MTIDMRNATQAVGYVATVEGGQKPIIICGPARGGTTALSVMLNGHAEILIGREVPLERLPSLRPLLDEIAEYHRHEWTEKRREEVVKGLWFAAARPAPYDKPDARRWGMKTPWAELDAELWDSLVQPQYVCAVRRGDRVFQSHLKLGWATARSPEALIGHYKNSLKAVEELRVRGSAHVVQLDLADTPQARRKLVEDLFAFLDEEIDTGVERFIDEWPTPRWSHPTSAGGPIELPDEWQQLLDADSEYREMMIAYGYR